MSTSILTPEQKAARWGTAAKIAAVGVVGFLVSPFILSALAGVVGLIVLAGIYGTTWMLLPAIGDWGKSVRLKCVKAQAAANPVETLQEEHRRQSVQLDERKEAITKMDGAIRTLDQTINALVREFPDSSEIPQMRADSAELHALKDSRDADWQEAYVNHGLFEKEIQRVKRLWEVSLAAAAARQQSGLSEDEWMAKLKTQTSIDAIRTKLNEQLSSLSTERMQADAQRILKGRMTVNVTPTQASLPAPDDRNVIDAALVSPAKSKVAR